MTIVEVIIGICITTPLILVMMAILSNTQAITRLFTSLADMFILVWESIAIFFGHKPKPVVEGNVKMTLDEMGMTLEDASDAHYDAEALHKIRVLHAREHVTWQKEFNRHVGRIWMLENDDPDIVEEATVEVLRDWEGNVVSKRVTPRASKTTQITHRNGMTHKSTEVCYKCDR